MKRGKMDFDAAMQSYPAAGSFIALGTTAAQWQIILLI
jgi:hypothetical protein